MPVNEGSGQLSVVVIQADKRVFLTGGSEVNSMNSLSWDDDTVFANDFIF